MHTEITYLRSKFLQLDDHGALNEFQLSYNCQFMRDGVRYERSLPDINIDCGTQQFRRVKFSDGSEFHVGWILNYPFRRNKASRVLLNSQQGGYYGVYPSLLNGGVGFDYYDYRDGNGVYRGYCFELNFGVLLDWVEVYFPMIPDRPITRYDIEEQKLG
jgi:hypothetical protein